MALAAPLLRSHQGNLEKAKEDGEHAPGREKASALKAGQGVSCPLFTRLPRGSLLGNLLSAIRILMR